jgi:hypothetical protein
LAKVVYILKSIRLEIFYTKAWQIEENNCVYQIKEEPSKTGLFFLILKGLRLNNAFERLAISNGHRSAKVIANLGSWIKSKALVNGCKEITNGARLIFDIHTISAG